MNEIKIIQDTFSVSVNEILRETPKAINSGLRAAARIILNKTRRNLRSMFPNSRHMNPNYKDSMYEGARITRPNDGAISVHVMGTRTKGSGTYRLRFFEGGTKERFQKTFKGKPLQKKRRLGKIKKLLFFKTAVDSTPQDRIDAVMDEKIQKYLEKKWPQK